MNAYIDSAQFNPVRRSKTSIRSLWSEGYDPQIQYAVFNSAVDYLFTEGEDNIGAGVESIFNIWLRIRNNPNRIGDFHDETTYEFIEENSNEVWWVTYSFIEAFNEELGPLGITYEEYEDQYIEIHQSL
ncbi:hypothetical protein OLMES_3681 [Oleiphilus messinensis]|uniref:Uncharacterized protein n=1 Tax=Oleiphilus messinensis TaxID=141451 RepID=A0A1Y0IAZ5_9GAMM|nr:hypothetical protein [Oleiphilus messinensis]ARU57702.1 hypothetical protein OLMES_3681 [Oleiphilus messinensis]